MLPANEMKKNMKEHNAKKRNLIFVSSVNSMGFLFQPITPIPRSVASEFRSPSSIPNTAINLSNNMKKILTGLSCLFLNEEGELHITIFRRTNVREYRNYGLFFSYIIANNSVHIIHHTKL